MWQVCQCANDRFISHRVGDKHYLSATADLLHIPKQRQFTESELMCPGGNSCLQQTVVVSVGSYPDVFVCFNSGKKIALLGTRARTGSLETSKIQTDTRYVGKLRFKPMNGSLSFAVLFFMIWDEEKQVSPYRGTPPRTHRGTNRTGPMTESEMSEMTFLPAG